VRKVLFLFGSLNDHDVEWMASAGRVCSVPAGTVIVAQGEDIDALYLVLDGLFAVSVTARATEREIARLHAGEVVGEISFVDSRPPSATVTAVQDSRVLRIARADLHRKLEETGFASRFYKALALFLADRLRSAPQRLGYGPVEAAGEPRDEAADVNPIVLQTVTLAGARFDHLLQHVRAH
jgi:CRP-like cAMP-binding protein